MGTREDNDEHRIMIEEQATSKKQGAKTRERQKVILAHKAPIAAWLPWPDSLSVTEISRSKNRESREPDGRETAR